LLSLLKDYKRFNLFSLKNNFLQCFLSDHAFFSIFFFNLKTFKKLQKFDFIFVVVFAFQFVLFWGCLSVSLVVFFALAIFLIYFNFLFH
jgi:hypothetical protein